jgi:hypothetical protein
MVRCLEDIQNMNKKRQAEFDKIYVDRMVDIYDTVLGVLDNWEDSFDTLDGFKSVSSKIAYEILKLDERK